MKLLPVVNMLLCGFYLTLYLCVPLMGYSYTLSDDTLQKSSYVIKVQMSNAAQVCACCAISTLGGYKRSNMQSNLYLINLYLA